MQKSCIKTGQIELMNITKEDTMRNFNQLDTEMLNTDLNLFDEDLGENYDELETVHRDSSTDWQATEAVYSETYNELSF
jgi:hypothetical protein